MAVKLSIVIPVYNAEKYIEKCLDSLINQTLEEIEVICVNDGSSDHSLGILQEYARKDSRIIVIDQENQGCNIARKNGYLCSGGEYFTLVDADDWLERDIYEIAITRMEEVDADCAIFNWYIEDGKDTKKCIGVERDCQFRGKEFIYQISLAGICGGCNPLMAGRYEGWPWNKIYRKNIFDDLYVKQKLFVDRMRHFDDAFMNIRLLMGVNNLLFLHQYGYHYRIGNSQSITGKFYKDLPPENDFKHYKRFAEVEFPILSKDEEPQAAEEKNGRAAGDSMQFVEEGAIGLYNKALNTMVVNLFWDYITKHHYFQKENPNSVRKQMKEINHLLAGHYLKNCYFPIKEAIDNAEIDWINNQIMCFLVKHHMVSAFSLYTGSRISLLKKNIKKMAFLSGFKAVREHGG